jgi:membrane protein
VSDEAPYDDPEELAAVVHPPEADAAASGRLARLKARQAALKARGEELAERAHAERGRHGSVDALFEMADRDGEVGGGIIAGALAYRLFIWLLPLALVAVAGLGIAADASSQSPEEAANSAGLAALVSSSVASAAKSSTRWYALIVGIPVLLYATRSVLRALIGTHRLVWTEVRSGAPKPTLGATVRLLVALVACLVLAGLGTTVRHDSLVLGILATILIAAPYAGIWLLVSLRLPHRQADWKALVPGALLFGFGLEILNVAAAYIFGPYSLSKQGTYGALGLAAVILFGLYLLGRLVVFSAVVNATLWERRQAQPTTAD